MIESAQLCISLFAVIAVVVLLAKRWKVPGPILLVSTGLLLALVPGLPHLRLDPHFALMLFLPPLIYAAAVQTSWPDFRANLRPIGLLAIGCVLFTTAAVAVTAHLMIGMNWALACVLGAVVSPPDAVAATSIAGRLTVPRRIVTVLEGEGMVNDATALIVYRFATAAVVSGVFSLGKAGLTFALVVLGEAVWGLVVGYLSTLVRRLANDVKVEVTFSLLTPFAAYWPAEYFGGSGVIATVAAGLWVSWNGPKFISSTARLQGRFFWDVMVFLVEGLLFLLTGLQFRDVFKSDFSEYALPQLVGYALVVCGVLVAVRFLWVFPATYLPRLIPGVGRRDPHPPWQHPMIVAFAGMRGGISLAAALALPLEIQNGQAFPHRDLIIFLTFCVIIVTLVGQGSTLPIVIRRLGVDRQGKAEADEEHRLEIQARKDIISTVDQQLPELTSKRRITSEAIHRLQSRRQERLKQLQRYEDNKDQGAHDIELIEMDLLLSERRRLYQLLQQGKVSDSARRRIEHELDLQEARLGGSE